MTRVRGRQNVSRRAVVLLEPDLLHVPELLLEPEDVLDLSATPAVDRLIVVADGAHVLPLAREQLDELELRAVRVLVFVDHEVTVAQLILVQQLGVGLPQLAPAA